MNDRPLSPLDEAVVRDLLIREAEGVAPRSDALARLLAAVDEREAQHQIPHGVRGVFRGLPEQMRGRSVRVALAVATALLVLVLSPVGRPVVAAVTGGMRDAARAVGVQVRDLGDANRPHATTAPIATRVPTPTGTAAGTLPPPGTPGALNGTPQKGFPASGSGTGAVTGSPPSGTPPPRTDGAETPGAGTSGADIPAPGTPAGDTPGVGTSTPVAPAASPPGADGHAQPMPLGAPPTAPTAPGGGTAPTPVPEATASALPTPVSTGVSVLPLPTVALPTVAVPTVSEEQCKGGGYRNYRDLSTGQPFANEGRCVSYAETGK
ncbi:MAG: hypothetical protein ACR2OO_07080 [Thermomicrobiales bacterium]